MLALADHEISRFPSKELPHMPVSATTPGRMGARTIAPILLPSVSGTTSAPRMRVLSRLNGWPVRSPVNASPMPSRAAALTRGRCGSLLLHRDGLAPSTPCRSPGALRFTPKSDRLLRCRKTTLRADTVEKGLALIGEQ